MSLAVGGRLGSYEILGLLAAGGPPPLARDLRELRRDRAVAKVERCR